MKTEIKYDVVFYEAFREEENALRRHLPEKKKYFFTWKTIQEAEHIHPPAPVVSIRTQSRIPIAWKNDIRALIARATGYDHLTAYLSESGIDIPAAYLPDYAARAVAEHAMMLWTSLFRKLPEQIEAVKTFTREGITGRELSGKTITVVGVGRIGLQIVDIAKALHMKVLGVDIRPNENLDIEYVTILEGVARADILVCALPLTELTRGMLNYDLLINLPKGAVFINIARGEISPPEDILSLLRDGVICGVGLDVYDCEKELVGIIRDGEALNQIEDLERRNSISATIELINNPYVITTPHNAFNTAESVERKSINTALNLKEFFSEGKFLTPIIRE